MSFDNLFSPIKIGALQLPNRIVMSPMTTDFGTSEQEVSARLLAYLEARASGGVGLITLEVCSVALDHRYRPNSLSLSEDRFIDQHRQLVDRIHAQGAKIQPQITHPGPESLAPFFEDKPGVGPSVNVNPAALQSCRPLELEEIPAVIAQYVDASLRAREAGYDGMELHAAHAYMLLGSFLSPLRNARRDEYGGRKLEGRARMLLETLGAIRQAVGPDFPITVSLSGYERFPGGREINESQRLAQMLVEAGADAFRVSGGTTDRLVTGMIMGSHIPDGLNVSQAEAIKQVVDVPVMVVGRIHTPEAAEAVITSGRADMVAMGRPFLADPEWPNKVKAGRRDDMRQCISCQNCIDSMFTEHTMSCAVNAATGCEVTHRIEQAETAKRVVVIGGGPAGMETARVAALRGHTVTLLEKQKRLGGSLLLASTVHADNEPLLDWLERQVTSSTIDVRLGEAATPELVGSLSPDAIVVATGARVETPTLRGGDQPHVYSGAQLRRLVEGEATPSDLAVLPTAVRGLAMKLLAAVSARWTPAVLRTLTRYYLPIGKRVVIVGADLAAIEVAEFLATRGRKVHILEQRKRIAGEIGPKRLTEHMDRLDNLGITVNTEVEVLAITSQHVNYATAAGAKRALAADAVILAGDPVAATSCYESMRGVAPEVHAVGDCTGLGLIRKATKEGMAVACQL